MSKIVWTRQARDDLRSIRLFIGRDAPYTATAYIKRLRRHVDRLGVFPDSGWIVAELSDPSIREIVFGNYRIIYRRRDSSVEILTVRHGASLLDDPRNN